MNPNHRKIFHLGIALMSLLTPMASHSADQTEGASRAPRVALHTNLGTITVELDAERAPKTVANFLAYLVKGHYDGTVFHRVIPGFMIQGGGFDRELQLRPTNTPIPNEADNGLKNVRGTIAMARTQDPHSARAQFFINLVDNPHLDHRDPSPQGWGYAVFGRVVAGMEVVDAIAKVPTTRVGPLRDVPVEPVVIERAERVE
ncbi:peptidyl-prolyl cis-trans isomerase [Hydrogenophilus thermoluteolus]|uniref:Peptidyl-prolyl cis-trans isomerase n=2 Tax=Hydrogenophilus thermoluteolus TaxID=297 RepID=A0A2Z6DYL8_HYDTE|nr:peptidyl-prolyl cis-trans isomerase [Hydrogenophilus thermoluteolus]